MAAHFSKKSCIFNLLFFNQNFYVMRFKSFILSLLMCFAFVGSGFADTGPPFDLTQNEEAKTKVTIESPQNVFADVLSAPILLTATVVKDDFGDYLNLFIMNESYNIEMIQSTKNSSVFIISDKQGSIYVRSIETNEGKSLDKYTIYYPENRQINFILDQGVSPPLIQIQKE